MGRPRGLYADDDKLDSETLIREYEQAFTAAGGRHLELLRSVPGDGHLLRRYPDRWRPIADRTSPISICGDTEAVLSKAIPRPVRPHPHMSLSSCGLIARLRALSTSREIHLEARSTQRCGNPPAGRRENLASGFTGAATGSGANFCRSVAIASAISTSPNCWPTQLRGPAPKGK